jgi:hypothetical protein
MKHKHLDFVFRRIPAYSSIADVLLTASLLLFYCKLLYTESLLGVYHIPHVSKYIIQLIKILSVCVLICRWRPFHQINLSTKLCIHD